MAKYRKKPVVIDAVKWTGDNVADVDGIADDTRSGAHRVFVVDDMTRRPRLAIQTLEGTMTAQPGDWIIRGVSGELYPCRPDIFDLTYEPVDG